MSDFISREDAVKLIHEAGKFSLEAMVADPDCIPSADVIPYRWIFVYLNNIPKDNSYKSFIIQEMLMDWRKENGQLEGIRW
jgi:hypothetical protein